MAGNEHSRRDFLKKSLAAAAAGSVVPYFGWSRKAFANASAADRPVIGSIGTGDRYFQIGPELAQFGDVVAVCDVDSLHADRAKHDPRLGKGKADAYKGYRKVLDRKDVDVVSIVTVDHWHVKIAIEALQAGKHVYCEKPLTLTLEENQLIRNACKRYNRAFQLGTWQRGMDTLFLRAVNMVQKGLLGDIRKIVVGINSCPTGGPFPKVAPPKELDWDLWLGQSPKVEYIKERCHYNFRWWYEYSGGKFTDWGAHHVDIATWALGQDKEGMGPIEIDGTDAKHPVPFKNGYPTVDNCYNTANDFAVKCKYANGVEMIVDSRSENGVRFEGTKGAIFVSRGKIAGKPIEENWDKDKFGPDDLVRMYKGKPFEGHTANFFRCVREGGLAVSDVFSHVQAMNTCHLCAIAARLGRKIRWDPKCEQILCDEQAAAFFARTPRPGFEIPRVQLGGVRRRRTRIGR
jgi:predicted dehydrogenase